MSASFINPEFRYGAYRYGCRGEASAFSERLHEVMVESGTSLRERNLRVWGLKDPTKIALQFIRRETGKKDTDFDAGDITAFYFNGELDAIFLKRARTENPKLSLEEVSRQFCALGKTPIPEIYKGSPSYALHSSCVMNYLDRVHQEKLGELDMESVAGEVLTEGLEKIRFRNILATSYFLEISSGHYPGIDSVLEGPKDRDGRREYAEYLLREQVYERALGSTIARVQETMNGKALKLGHFEEDGFYLTKVSASYEGSLDNKHLGFKKAAYGERLCLFDCKFRIQDEGSRIGVLLTEQDKQSILALFSRRIPHREIIDNLVEAQGEFWQVPSLAEASIGSV